MIESQYWLHRRFKKKNKISPIQAIKTEFHLDDDGKPRNETSFSDALSKIIDENDLEEEERNG